MTAVVHPKTMKGVSQFALERIPVIQPESRNTERGAYDLGRCDALNEILRFTTGQVMGSSWQDAIDQMETGDPVLEYKTVSYKILGPTVEMLNKMGQERWQLLSVTCSDGRSLGYFGRSKKLH